jgi:chemotaxis protein methyltransferase CheR
MTVAEYRLLRDLIYRHCGISFDDSKRFLLERRLQPRLEVTGAADFGEYARLLRYGEHGVREMQEVIDRITTNETYFFREEYQLRSFAEEILPELRRTRTDRRLTIWSAGCATGEEPYTVSMLLAEVGGFRGWDIRIIGSDISARVLRAARAARYKESALRDTSLARRTRFFHRDDAGYEVMEWVREPVGFAQLNLLDDTALDLLGEVDVVFCRNVLIYFDAAARERVIDSIYRRMSPGGYLLLGHAETLLTLSTAFELVQLRYDTIYQKPRGAGEEGQ